MNSALAWLSVPAIGEESSRSKKEQAKAAERNHTDLDSGVGQDRAAESRLEPERDNHAAKHSFTPIPVPMQNQTLQALREVVGRTGTPLRRSS